MRSQSLSRAIALGLLLSSGWATAATDAENFAAIPFSFSNPGARSLGMGGAFLAVADDATAAYTNPAGLTQLGIGQQASFEVRHDKFENRFVNGGRLDQYGAGATIGRQSDSNNNLSFVSWGLGRENWSVAVYRHELVNFESRFSHGDFGVFDQFNQNIANFFPVDSFADLQIVNLGASFGFKLNDNIAIGAGLSRYSFDIDGRVTRYQIGNAGAIQNVQAQHGSDDDVGFNLGALFKVTDNFAIGLSYRSGAEFAYQSTNGSSVGEVNFADKASTLKTPSMIGLGLNWRVTEQLALRMDVNQIDYSNLTSNMQSAFSNDGVFAQNDADAKRISISDETEVRLGVEYAFANVPLYLRAGTWREKAHTMRYAGSFLDQDYNLHFDAPLFPGGTDESHYSFGAGYTFGRFEINAATDQSNNGDIYSLSGVVRF